MRKWVYVYETQLIHCPIQWGDKLLGPNANKSCLVWMSHVSYVNELVPLNEETSRWDWLQMSHVSYEWVMSHIWMSWSHSTRRWVVGTNCEWVMSRMNELCVTCEWVGPHSIRRRDIGTKYYLKFTQWYLFGSKSPSLHVVLNYIWGMAHSYSHETEHLHEQQ